MDAGPDQIVVPEKRGLRTLLAYLGPGFLVAIAYIDPGNFESDLKAGAKYKYELLWIIVIASCAALLIQSLAANLGVVTGKHLAEHCRTEYPSKVNFLLWIAAEVSIVASDIPEVLGTAFALNLLFKIPVWAGVILTGLSTLILLALQQYGVRKLEFFIALLVFTMAGCFFAELAYARPPVVEVLKGMFIPRLNGDGATRLAISLLGAMVMPHNLFLHSALVLSRRTPRTVRGIKDACKFYFMESAFALFVAFLINIFVNSVSGAVCSDPTLAAGDKEKCENLDLNQASFLLKNVLGSWSSKLFGIALLASGQSSTITGTYAGQYVMQGFLNLRFVPWVRNLLTRSVAIGPSLLAAILGGSSGAGNLIIISSIILSFELPFALLPLLKFTSSKTKMGPYKNTLTGIRAQDSAQNLRHFRQCSAACKASIFSESLHHGSKFAADYPARALLCAHRAFKCESFVAEVEASIEMSKSAEVSCPPHLSLYSCTGVSPYELMSDLPDMLRLAVAVNWDSNTCGDLDMNIKADHDMIFNV